MARPDEPKDSDLEKRKKKEIGRRDFVKLMGGASAAVTTAVLASDKLLGATPGSGPGPQQMAGVAMGKVIGPGPVPLTLRINGAAKKVAVEPRTTLLDTLRNFLDLTGSKKVCDRATCGACTVIINGHAKYSCTVLAIDVADRPGKPGADIRTIEGIGTEAQMHAVSAAFVNNDAQQCGFCTPGFVMSCKAYVDQHSNPTRDEVKHALGGNLCRCGTYMGVRQAAVDAAHAKGGRA
jgi:xanthine dehydrogenase YagT iron-sulfur-binding subunit